MGDKNPYDTYDLPDYPPATEYPETVNGARQRQSKKPTAPNYEMASPEKEDVNTRPSMRRRMSKNVMEEEIHVVKKRLGSAAPKSLLAKRYPREKMKRIDYVIVHGNKTLEETHDAKKRKELSNIMDMRLRFEAAMFAEGLEVQEDIIGELTYLKVHTPFWRLAKEAESIRLEMPLKGCELYDDDDPCCGITCWESFKDKHLVTDDEVDFVSAAFQMDKLQVFVNADNPDQFFRPAIRAFLTDHILMHMDIRDKKNKERDEEPLAKKGLPYLLHKGVYKDSYIMHDETFKDPMEKAEMDEKLAEFGSQVDIENPDHMDSAESLLLPDTRRKLDITWTKIYKFQPLWKIRNYFGEKIALYFAWSGCLISTLWIPTLFGLACFFYGLYLSITDSEVPELAANATLVDKVANIVEESLSTVKKSFDNDVTPFFALVICLWGTIFLEVWKRKNATLAYEWDVDNFEDTELDRPQFVGTHVKPDPVIPGEDTWYYPLYRQGLKYLTSLSMLLFMVCLVFITVAGVILYRVLMEVDYCEDLGSVGCLLTSTIASSLLNAVFILVLGKVYDIMAVKLTNWENHRTQTQYDDALIIKLFAFQFANSYSSLFYIAFFRGNTFDTGIFGLGPEYQDNCGTDNNCMAMLSFQVLVLMLVKPLPKFLKDIILPFLKKLWRTRRCCRKSKVDTNNSKVVIHEFLEREKLKPDLGDFTLGEYTEKVIVYGFLMLFAASFPLAPLIALLINLIDIRVDAKRMIWWYRRPVSRIAQDIGMWYGILEFLNIAGVVSNGFLIAFTSSWGSQFSTRDKLWVVIGFEHIVFGVKFLIAALIPDEPGYVRLGRRREKYQVAKIMEAASKKDSQVMPNGKSLSQQPAIREAIAELEETPEHDESQLLPRGRRNKKKKKKQLDRETELHDSSRTLTDDQASMESEDTAGNQLNHKRKSYLRRMVDQSSAAADSTSTYNTPSQEADVPDPSQNIHLPELQHGVAHLTPWQNVWGQQSRRGDQLEGESMTSDLTPRMDSHRMAPLPPIHETRRPSQLPVPDSSDMYAAHSDDNLPPPSPRIADGFSNYYDESAH